MAFTIDKQELSCEGVRLADVADAYGTPTFVYSAKHIEDRYNALAAALSDLEFTICYAVKANSNQAVLSLLSNLNAGADVVSIGEYRRARRANIPTNKIVFAGVGKTREEMAEALLGGLLQFNVESIAELNALNEVAAKIGSIAPVALRINPDVDAKTHAKITTGKAENKFGIPLTETRDLIADIAAYPNIRLESLAVHIGSQLTDLEPYETAYQILADMAHSLITGGHKLKRIDVGGGLGVKYDQEVEADLSEYARILTKTFKPLGLPLVLEPGRFLVANAGGLLTRSIFIKEGQKKRFVITDAAMNDLIRPALYDAYHGIQGPTGELHQLPTDVVGPVCETGDVLAVGRNLPVIKSGELLLIEGAGAYAAVMGSTYNTRPLPAEVLVRGNRFDLIRPRQDLDMLINADLVPKDL